MKEMIRAMDEIWLSANEMQRIIKGTEDIAYQTIGKFQTRKSDAVHKPGMTACTGFG